MIPQITPADFRMDEQYLHLLINIFRNCEAEIQPLTHLIMPNLQGLSNTRTIEWEEDKDFITYHVRSMNL